MESSNLPIVPHDEEDTNKDNIGKNFFPTRAIVIKKQIRKIISLKKKVRVMTSLKKKGSLMTSLRRKIREMTSLKRKFRVARLTVPHQQTTLVHRLRMRPKKL